MKGYHNSLQNCCSGFESLWACKNNKSVICYMTTGLKSTSKHTMIPSEAVAPQRSFDHVLFYEQTTNGIFRFSIFCNRYNVDYLDNQYEVVSPEYTRESLTYSGVGTFIFYVPLLKRKHVDVNPVNDYDRAMKGI